MAKYFGIFIFAVFFAASQGRHAVRRDVSKLLRHHASDHAVYGNGIEGKDAEIEHQHFDIDEQGNYDFAYKQTDLQERHEKGEVSKNPHTGISSLDNVVGSYKYVRPDGYTQIVEYRADENGFVPKITIIKDDVSYDPPNLFGFPTPFPIGSSTESGNNAETTAAAGLKKINV